MADAEQQEQQPLEAAPLGGGGGTDMRHIKLSDFWPHASQLWFLQTECRFAAHRIINEFARYCLVVGALPHNSLRRVADIFETPLQETPYSTIKQRLLGAHQMTDYQRAEKLYLTLWGLPPPQFSYPARQVPSAEYSRSVLTPARVSDFQQARFAKGVLPNPHGGQGHP
jgi:hypothetical protein